MSSPPLEQFYRSMEYPERAFRMFLCSNDLEALDSRDAKRLEDMFEVPSVFCEAMVDFLFKVKRSGFANMQIRTEVVKQGRKRMVQWEAGTSQRDYLNEKDLQNLQEFVELYYRSQGEKHGLIL